MSYKSCKLSYRKNVSKDLWNDHKTTNFANLFRIEYQQVNNSLITHLHFLYNK